MGFKFLENNGYPQFPNAKFRGDSRAAYTTIFGPDFSGATGKTCRQHIAWDRGRGDYGLVYSPFALSKIDGVPNNDFGYMLILYPVDADFTIRIAHMHPQDDVSPAIQKVINRGMPVECGALLGNIGKFSITYPNLLAHTHTEVVSIGPSSEVLDWIIADKFQTEDVPMSDEPLFEYMMHRYAEEQIRWPEQKLPNLNLEQQKVLFQAYKKDIEGRRIVGTGVYSVFKIDYLDGKKRTWYSSKDLLDF